MSRFTKLIKERGGSRITRTYLFGVAFVKRHSAVANLPTTMASSPHELNRAKNQ
jgi:hypothetical protein